MSYHRFQSKVWVCECKPRCATLDDCHAPRAKIEEYGSFEVFYKTDAEIRNEWDSSRIGDTLSDLTGWYWWACFPGCLPDGEPQGPYESEQEAIEMAQAEA